MRLPSVTEPNISRIQPKTHRAKEAFLDDAGFWPVFKEVPLIQRIFCKFNLESQQEATSITENSYSRKSISPTSN